MKKMKTLLLTLALGFTFAAAATAVACGKDEGASGTGSSDSSTAGSSSSTDWFAGEEESLVSLRFASAFVEVKQYENVSLEYSVKGALSAVEFTSSNEEIATVDANGVLTTYGALGSTVITASVDGVTATCEVSVVKTSYVPTIIVDSTDLTIVEGDEYEFSVATEWNKTELSEDIEYAVTLAEESQGASSQISVEGNVVKIVAGDVEEEFDVIVSTTVRGIYTSKSVHVNVIAPKLSVQSSSADFIPVAGKYVATIAATDAFDDVNSIPMAFTTTLGEQTIDAEINWNISSDAVAIENGNLVGKKRGAATLTGTVEYEGATATVTVECEVYPAEAHIEQTAEIEVENLQTLIFQSDLIGSLQNAELHGNVVSTIANSDDTYGHMIFFNKDALPTEASKLGRQQLVINTDLVRYTMDADIYTMIINDKNELNQMKTIADTGAIEFNSRYSVWKSSQIFDGYFVLGNDIDYNDTITSMTDTGSVWWCQGFTADHTRGFRGVFDGRGYNIDGVTVGTNPSGSDKESGGIFGYVSKTGIVKNVSFTNATLLAGQGFICAMGDGTMENVSVHYKKIGGDKKTDSINSDSPRTMGTFFSYQSGSNATVKNCLIDASAADITVETGVTAGGTKTINTKLMGTAKNVSNVIVLCPNQTLLSYSGADINKLNYVELAKEIELFDKFDSSIWTTVENVPMFINQAATLDVDAEVGFLSLDDSLVAGFEMLILPSNPYVKIELSVPDGVTGVVFEDSLLKASEPAFTSTVTLTVTSLFNPEKTAEHRVYIDSFGKKVAVPDSPTDPIVYNTNNVLEIGDNSTWMGEENYVYIGADIISIGNGAEKIEIDLDKLVWGAQDVTVVSVKNGEREHFDVELTKWYTAGDKADATKLFDSAFSGRLSNGEYTFTEKESDIEAPEGYANVTRMDCGKEWSTAASSEFFNMNDVSAYSDLWFAIRIVNGRFVQNEIPYNGAVSDWIYFHYIQTSDGVWAVELTFSGKTYTLFDITGTQMNHIIYRNGWGNGFLFYNNNSGGAVSAATPTQFYATDVYAIEK